MKKALHIAVWILGLLMVLLLGALVALQSPSVQTALGQRVVERISSDMPADIRFQLVSVRPFDALVLENVVIEDPAPKIAGMDTLAYIGKLTAKFSLKGLLSGKGAYLSRLELEKGCFNYGREPDPESPTGTFSNLQRIFGLPYPEEKEKDPAHWGKILKAGHVSIDDFTFRYCNLPGQMHRDSLGRKYRPGTIKWTDFSFVIQHLRGRNIEVADDLVTGDIQLLEFCEPSCGMQITGGQGLKVSYGKEKIQAASLQGYFGDSFLHLEKVLLELPGGSFSDFVNKVPIHATFVPDTHIGIRDFQHLAGSLSKLRFHAYIQGPVDGPVCDLHLNRVTFKDRDTNIRLCVNGNLYGLPEIDDTGVNFQLDDFSFSLDHLDDFIRSWAPSTKINFNSLAPGRMFSLRGNVTGLLKDMKVKGTFDSSIGKILADISLANCIYPERGIDIGGKLATENLDAGVITGVEALGPVTLSARAQTRVEEGDFQARIDTLQIARLNALGYDYTGLSAAGTYREDAFDGRIIAADPNLNFLFQGLFNLSRNTRNAAYQFYANLGYADLHALHLDKRENSKVSLEASSNFVRTQGRDLLGDITLKNIVLESNTGVHDIGDLSVKAHSNDNLHRIRATSDFLDASFVGDNAIGQFVGDLRSLVLDRDLPALVSHHAEPWQGGTYEVSLKVGKAQDLLTFLVPGLWVENKTEAKLKLDSDGIVTASLTSGRLALGDKYIKDVKLDFNNAEEVLQATVTSPMLSFGSGQLRSNRLSFFADDNHFGLGYSFDNDASEATKAELYLTGELSRDREGLGILARALPSNIYYKGNGWGLSSSDILYKGGEVKVNRLEARHEDELLTVDGGYSPTRVDTLSVRMEKFDIGLVNTFTGGVPLVEGRATGQALVVSPAIPSVGLLAGISCDSTRVSGHSLGRLQLQSAWDEQEQRFNVAVTNNLGGKRNLDASGYLVPSSKKVHARAQLDRLPMGCAEDLLASLFSDFEGGLSGELGVDGTLSDLHLSSKGLRIEDGRLEVDYLRVPYFLSGPLSLDDEGLHFQNVQLSDQEKGTGTLSGSILFGGFRSIGMDTHISLDKMHVISLPQGVNSLMYGSVYGGGQVDIVGPLSKMALNVDAYITDTSNLHLVTSSSSSDKSSELLAFKEMEMVQEQDAYEQMLQTQQKTKSGGSNVTFNLRARATPDLNVFLDLADNSLNANGNGTIEISTNLKDGGFTMGGDYTLLGGNFHVSVMNLVTRDFIIQEGSSIRFGGDIWNTDLDVTGLYVTKTSLATLLSDETASNRRTVNCGIHISGKIKNPVVDFSIDIPDLNPGTQTQVEAVLNTEDKIQKQFVYLLVAGNFLPGEDSGISANGSDVLLSNVTSIMTGQLNNIFQKLDIPLDLGLNYQATQTGSNLFDVAVSTQLFNNRVLVNGTVGNKQLVGGTTTNEIAGDMDIEIKLNRSGTLRLNVFTHSADQFTYFLDNSQRNGAGLTYQREFNSFRQFFRELLMSRQQREEAAAALARQPSVVLQIDENGLAHEQ